MGKFFKTAQHSYEATLKVVGSTSGIEQLSKLVEYIKRIGNTGHSFEIIVDPDYKESKKTFGWDGDGSDRIETVNKI